MDELQLLQILIDKLDFVLAFLGFFCGVVYFTILFYVVFKR